MNKHSIDFGKKERLLNYACQIYQLSRPDKVGAVMALIRDCQPSSFEEWVRWYFDNAHTERKNSIRITPASLKELGERLYTKITEFVIPEWESAFRALTEQNRINYNLTINRTYDGYIREKSVIKIACLRYFLEFLSMKPTPIWIMPAILIIWQILGINLSEFRLN